MRKDSISVRFLRSLFRSVGLLALGWFFFSPWLGTQTLWARQNERDIAPAQGATPPMGIILAQHRRDERSQNRFEQWQHMNPAEKETLRRRMDQYKQMAPQDRQRYRQRFDQWKGLSQEEQNQIDQKLEKWRDLSPAEKEDVRKRFR